ncbi:MAG: PTS sugar transporter subunit IIA [Candidatus Malihini olakiniferum]
MTIIDDDNTLGATGVFIQIEQPISLDTIDNQGVDLIFALLVPVEQCKNHLHTLSFIAKRLADKSVFQCFTGHASDEELYQIMIEAD